MIFKSILVALIFAPLFWFGGCADNPDSDIRNAQTVTTIADIVVSEGLEFLEKESPDLVSDVQSGLQLVVSQIALYNDGVASPEDFLITITSILEEINRIADSVDDDLAKRILKNVAKLDGLIELYIDPVELPDQVPLYANALGAGISQGLADYMSGGNL